MALSSGREAYPGKPWRGTLAASSPDAREKTIEIGTHRLDRRRAVATAVAGKDPAKAMFGEARERADLLAPRKPTDVAAGVEPTFVAPQMIAGEEELVAVEKRRAAARVA